VSADRAFPDADLSAQPVDQEGENAPGRRLAGPEFAVRSHGGSGLIAVDTNILVYAHREELPKHAAARDRLVSLAEGRARWAIPTFVLGEFLRIITHRKLFHPPFTPDEACLAVSRILGSPSLFILHPGPAYIELLLAAIRETQAAGNLIFDAQIVALCREAGVRALLTEDRDFARFPGFATESLG
jgi:toxin-antitoxin system PIN domain toxin